MPKMVIYECEGVKLIEDYSKVKIGKVKYSQKRKEALLKDIMEDINNLANKCSNGYRTG